MRGERYVTAYLRSKVDQLESAPFTELPDSPMDRTCQALALGTHSDVLYRHSKSRKTLYVTGRKTDTGRLTPMGAHKKSPPQHTPRKVTPLLVKQIKSALSTNEVYNLQHKLKKDDPEYRPESQFDLAQITGANPTQIKNMLGGVRPGTKTKPVGKSRYVDPICDALGIERLVRIEAEVPARVAEFVRRLLALDADGIAEIERIVAEARKKQ